MTLVPAVDPQDHPTQGPRAPHPVQVPLTQSALPAVVHPLLNTQRARITSAEPQARSSRLSLLRPTLAMAEVARHQTFLPLEVRELEQSTGASQRSSQTTHPEDPPRVRLVFLHTLVRAMVRTSQPLPQSNTNVVQPQQSTTPRTTLAT